MESLVERITLTYDLAVMPIYKSNYSSSEEKREHKEYVEVYLYGRQKRAIRSTETATTITPGPADDEAHGLS